MTTEQQYIEHEVQIRVLKERSDEKVLASDIRFSMMQKNSDDRFNLMQKNFDDKFTHLDHKLNFILGLITVGVVIPSIIYLLEWMR